MKMNQKDIAYLTIIIVLLLLGAFIFDKYDTYLSKMEYQIYQRDSLIYKELSKPERLYPPYYIKDTVYIYVPVLIPDYER